MHFTFRKKIYPCTIFIDSSADPCYIFVILRDKELINEFGDEVTIKTDCENRLPKMDDYPELVELRQAIFDAVKTIPEFIDAKRNIMLLNDSKRNYQAKPLLSMQDTHKPLQHYQTLPSNFLR